MNEKLMRRVLWIVMAAGLVLLAATLFASDDAARRSAQDSAVRDKKQGFETITVMKERDEAWRIGCYFIK